MQNICPSELCASRPYTKDRRIFVIVERHPASRCHCVSWHLHEHQVCGPMVVFFPWDVRRCCTPGGDRAEQSRVQVLMYTGWGRMMQNPEQASQQDPGPAVKAGEGGSSLKMSALQLS